MNTDEMAITSLPDHVDAAYEHVSYGINLLSLLVIEDSLVRLKRKGSDLPTPDALQAMREALINATVLAKRNTLEAAYTDVHNFWMILCEYAQQAGLTSGEQSSGEQRSGEQSSGEAEKSPLALKDPRALSLISFLRCVENLRSIMCSETGNKEKLEEVPRIITLGNSFRTSLVVPADRVAALDDISRAVADAFDSLNS